MIPERGVQVAPADWLCVSPQEQDKLRDAIVTLEKCQIDLKARQDLLEARLPVGQMALDAPWWKDPSFIDGGIVVSFSVAGVLGYMVGSRLK